MRAPAFHSAAELAYDVGYHWPFHLAAVAYFMAFGIATILYRRLQKSAILG